MVSLDVNQHCFSEVDFIICYYFRRVFNMKYRKFGNTGNNISVLGFGCMRLPEYEKDGKWFVDEEKSVPLLRKAYESGVNYFDSAYYYLHSNSEAIVGKALKPYRDKVFLTSKIPVGEVNETSDYRKFLETSLKRMDTDYIDFYHFWGINKGVFDDKMIKLKLLEEAVKAKEEGLIRHISFSFHDDPENMKYIIDNAPMLETVLVQYNLLDRSCEKQIEYAVSKGLGVVAMGPVGGGRLAAPTDLTEKITGSKDVSTYELAFKFVLGNSNISCALSGMENEQMLDANVAVASEDSTLSGDEWVKISKSMEKLKKFSELYCTGCDYCQPCPAGIGISKIFNAYTHYNVYGLTDLAKREYNEYLNDPNQGKTIEDCIDCGYCEEKCPQKIKIRKQLARVADILELQSKE